MLRVTPLEDAVGQITLHVEGQIVAGSADLLEAECRRLLDQYATVRLNLADVVYVDARGADVLGRLSSDRVCIVRCRPLVRDLIEGVRPC